MRVLEAYLRPHSDTAHKASSRRIPCSEHGIAYTPFLPFLQGVENLREYSLHEGPWWFGMKSEVQLMTLR
jgi:hypothetical protein